jgi:hypothetical protein
MDFLSTGKNNSMNRSETSVNKIFDELKITIPDDLLLLHEIVYARGAEIHEHNFEGAEASLLIGPGRPIISIPSPNNIDHHRRRFSIAHELGHLEMHRENELLRSCTAEDIQDKLVSSPKIIEHETNQFASSFLLPTRFVEIPFRGNPPSFTIISEYANKLDTSLTATALRYITITHEPIAVIYSFRGVIKYFRQSSKFFEFGVKPEVNSPVGSHTGAFHLFTGSTSPNKWQKVRAVEWLHENNQVFHSDDNVFEWSIGMPNYEAVLSLLWLKEPFRSSSG